MWESLITKIGLAFAALVSIFTTGQLPLPVPTEEPAGVGVDLPGGIAVFETSLASRIYASSTSMTLASALIRGGSTISGYQCFSIDEGSAQAEFVCGTVSGTTVSSLERGISPAD